MTEGIIQKVFTEYVTRDKENGGFNFMMHTDVLRMQQELIKEIRVRSRGYNDSYEKLVMLEDLIGDGKE